MAAMSIYFDQSLLIVRTVYLSLDTATVVYECHNGTPSL